jgi:hypothetical protein
MKYGGNGDISNPRDYRPPRAHQGFFPKSSVNASGDKIEEKVLAPLPKVPALNPS